MDLHWTAFKAFIVARLLPIQYIDSDGYYFLEASDGFFDIRCKISQDGGADVTDFETNYKNAQTTNTTPLQTIQVTTFTSRSLVSHGVRYFFFPRNTGLQVNVTNGSNTITYTATYQWVKFIGIEVINATAGDFASVQILDSTTGTYSGTNNLLLAQFGYTLNIAPNFYSRTTPFDADLFVGMQMKFTYNSASVLGKSIGLNLIMNEVKVAPPLAITNPVTGYSY